MAIKGVQPRLRRLGRRVKTYFKIISLVLGVGLVAVGLILVIRGEGFIVVLLGGVSLLFWSVGDLHDRLDGGS